MKHNGIKIGGIEKGIKMPKVVYNNGRKAGVSKYPFDSLKKGDSFVVAVAKKGNGLNANKLRVRVAVACNVAKKKGGGDKKYALRKVSDTEVRVWRTA